MQGLCLFLSIQMVNSKINTNNKHMKFSSILLAVVVAIAVTFYLYNNSASNKKLIKSVSTVNFKFGLTGNCRGIPKFVAPLKMRTPALDSRQQDGVMGLQIRDYSQKNKVWRHPSWGVTGYIGTFDRDKRGNVYVFPVPYVSLLNNPPEKQNQLYIIDSKTAKMSLFMKLPSETEPNLRNPFGVMGVYYDCDTDSLYVSSVAGTKPIQETGTIYQINVKTRTILSKLENTDAVGVGVFNTSKGKRLYYGSARSSNLF